MATPFAYYEQELLRAVDDLNKVLSITGDNCQDNIKNFKEKIESLEQEYKTTNEGSRSRLPKD